MISLLINAIVIAAQLVGLNEGLRVNQNGRVIIPMQHHVDTAASGDVLIIDDATWCPGTGTRIVVLAWVVDCASTETFQWEEEGNRLLTSAKSLEAIAPFCSAAGCFWTETLDDDLEFQKAGTVQCGIDVVFTCVTD